MLEDFGGVELALALVKGFVFRFDQRVQVGQDGVIGGLHPVEIGAVGDAPLVVELLQHDLDGIDLPVVKILVYSR